MPDDWVVKAPFDVELPDDATPRGAQVANLEDWGITNLMNALWSDFLWEDIEKATNTYREKLQQKNPNKRIPYIHKHDLLRYHAILLAMGVNIQPRLSDYWSDMNK